MDLRKMNKQTWRSLCLTFLLCVAAMGISVGTAQARYRAERKEAISFRVREREQICIGGLREATKEEADADGSLSAGDMIFDPAMQPQWVTTDDVPRLTIAVANGISKTDFSKRDQKISLRMIGTVGFWTGEATPKVELRVSSQDEALGYYTVQATVSAIQEGTVLGNTYGEGWLLTFYEKENEEVSWILEGGKLNYVTMTVVVEDVTVSELSLLRSQVIAEVISE